jgi:hypothetical protein
VQPAGAWLPVKARVFAADQNFCRDGPFTRDAFNTIVALLAISALYVGTLYLILHRHQIAALCFGGVVVLSFVLFFTWYEHLPPSAPSECETKAGGETATVLAETVS